MTIPQTREVVHMSGSMSGDSVLGFIAESVSQASVEATKVAAASGVRSISNRPGDQSSPVDS